MNLLVFWLCLSVCLSVCPSVLLSVCPSVRLSVFPSVRLSVCHYVCMSVCPSVCLSVSVLSFLSSLLRPVYNCQFFLALGVFCGSGQGAQRQNIQREWNQSRPSRPTKPTRPTTPNELGTEYPAPSLGRWGANNLLPLISASDWINFIYWFFSSVDSGYGSITMKCRVLPKEFWIPTGMCLGLFLVYLTYMYSIHTCVLACVEACQAPRPENIGRKLDTLNFTNMAKTGRGELWAQKNRGGGRWGDKQFRLVLTFSIQENFEQFQLSQEIWFRCFEF